MSQKQKIVRLQPLGQLLLDTRLSALRRAAKARQESEDLLAALSAPNPQAEAISEIAAELVGLNYNRWADARRAEINRALARQTAALLEAQDDAREAFGRLQAIKALKERNT